MALRVIRKDGRVAFFSPTYMEKFDKAWLVAEARWNARPWYNKLWIRFYNWVYRWWP